MPLPVDHDLYTYYSQYQSQLNSARTEIVWVNSAMTQLKTLIAWTDPVNGPIQWQAFLDNLIDYMQFAIASNWTPDQFPQLEFMSNEYDYWGGDLDMDTLLSTMLGADIDQVTYFIGLVDAYRVGIMNRPFNAEYFAALARGWTQ